MLSSNSSSCNHNNPNYTPFFENDTTSFSSSKSQHQQDPNNNFFFSFPNSPHMHFDYDDVYLHFLDHAEDLHSITNMAADWNDKITPSCSIGGGNPNTTVAEHRRPSAAARSSKKDRHSKIDTARGPRDRRMRLSLDIARKFFDLQDMLGYDKASRTVDWLLRNSSSAIRDLARGRDGLLEHSSLALAESCTSEDCGEAVSSSVTGKVMAAVAEEEGKNKCGRKRKRGGGGVVQKRATVGRESRRKARDRARERTSQKGRLMRERERESGAAAAAAAAAAGTTHNFPIYDALSLRSDEARIITGGATAEEILCQFDFHDTNTEILQQGEKIAEIEFNIGKPWEAYTSYNLSE